MQSRNLEPYQPVAAAPAVNLNITTTPVIITGRNGHGLFTRFVWFCFIGWWFGPFVAVLGWLLTVSVVLMPLGLGLIARVPGAVSLRPRTEHYKTELRNGVMHVKGGNAAQRSWLIRFPYLVCFGAWVGLVWILLACVFTLPLINLLAFPLAIAMFDRTAAVMTLHRN